MPKRLSGAGLLLDVMTAFAAVLRRLFLDHTMGDEAWLKSLYEFGFDHVDVSNILTAISRLLSHRVNSGDSPPTIPYALAKSCLS